MTLEGAGRAASTLKSASPSTDGELLDAPFNTGVTIRDLGFDGQSEANLRYAIHSVWNGAEQFLRIQRCRFKDVRASNSRAIWVWRSQAIWIEGNEFQDCVIPIFLDAAKGDCYVIGNKIWSPAALTVNGIELGAPSAGSRPVAVIGNTVENVQVDPSGNGIDGHGIRLFRSQGVRVEGNLCRDCHTSGILCGVDSFGSVVTGNACIENRSANRGTGIYVELQGSDTTIGTSGDIRGASVTGNLCADGDPELRRAWHPYRQPVLRH